MGIAGCAKSTSSPTFPGSITIAACPAGQSRQTVTNPSNARDDWLDRDCADVALATGNLRAGVEYDPLTAAVASSPNGSFSMVRSAHAFTLRSQLAASLRF
jgi:hypothetical protein